MTPDALGAAVEAARAAHERLTIRISDARQMGLWWPTSLDPYMRLVSFDRPASLTLDGWVAFAGLARRLTADIQAEITRIRAVRSSRVDRSRQWAKTNSARPLPFKGKRTGK